MDTTFVALQKFQSIVIDKLTVVTQKESQAYVLTLNANLMSQGYMLSESLFNTLLTSNRQGVIEIAKSLMPVVKQLKGSHVKHQPMYPNFSQQVVDASEAELYLNALRHYYSLGKWLPTYEIWPRSVAFEDAKFEEIGQIDTETFRGLFTTLLSSRDSLSEEDKGILKWFMGQEYADSLQLPEAIPFHENKCLVAAQWLEERRDIAPLVKTATDILRIVTYLSEGDVSLASNTRFKSLPRAKRRVLINQLECVISEEDIGRHRNKWVRLFHNLHIGDYANKKAFKIAKKARNGGRLKSFYSDLQVAIDTSNIEACVALLKTRPGEYGRKIDHMLRLAAQNDAVAKHVETDDVKPSLLVGGMDVLNQFMSKFHPVEQRQQQLVLREFLSVVNEIPSRNLYQLMGHLNTRHQATSERVIFPKGSLQKAVVVNTYFDAINTNILMALKEGVRMSLVKRLQVLEPLGKVWIASELIDCPLPTQQRSASAGLHNMARGTRLPISTAEEIQNTIRLFAYWKGMDIDLSASFHDEQGHLVDQVSYTNLKSGCCKAYHSGDITRAKQGASEFIDIDIPSTAGIARYLVMNVIVFNGPTFAEHETCFVGWMTRAEPNSNEIYEPATVAQKIDLTQEAKHSMPVVFDLQERKIIWTDLPLLRFNSRPNNVENNQASIEQKLMTILNVTNKLSLYELFELHAEARGELVETREEADTVFALGEGITPFDVNTINADFMV